jgi:hypothetical protein
VVDCQICSSTGCVACISGKLLIGTSLCISSCSSNQIYNITNKSCDTVIIDNSTDKNSTITISPTAVNINFVPMPFLIIFILISILVFILHFRNKLSAVPTLYGIIGFIIFLSSITIIILSFTSTNDSTLHQIGLYCLIISLIYTILAGLVSTILWYKLCGR